MGSAKSIVPSEDLDFTAQGYIVGLELEVVI